MELKDQLDALQGQIAALSLTLTAIIPTLSPLQSAQAACALAIEKEGLPLEDQAVDTPPYTRNSRDSLLAAYLGLLASRR